MALEIADETRDDVAKKVYPSDRPRLKWKEERQAWIMMWDEVGLTLDTTPSHLYSYSPPLATQVT